MIVITLGANLEMKADRAVQLYQLIASAKIILCQNEIDNNATKMALEIAKKNNGENPIFIPLIRSYKIFSKTATQTPIPKSA